MHRRILTLLLGAWPAIAAAQRAVAPGSQALPRDVRREVVDRWNGPNALRASTRTQIARGQAISGNVAVAGGPAVVAGHVTGNVLAVNADVLLEPTARIDGSLLVVGGEVEGQNLGRVGGVIRIYRQILVYHQDSTGRMAAVPNDTAVAGSEGAAGGADESWWRRLEHRHEGNWTEALRVVQAGAYNRVEGLPIELGPALNRRTPWGSVRLDAAAVVRTGSFNSANGDIGHDVRTEVRVGGERAVGVGGRLFDIVDPVESWQLSGLEAALAAFLARRDYRDYYQRHGGNAFVTLYGAPNLSLTGSYGEERWSSRELRNPFTLFNADQPWRPNPLVDEGLFHVATTSLTFDTRTDPDDPWSGWYVNGNIEYGRGSIASLAPSSDVRAANPGGDAVTDYTRGLFDLRRYNRLGPNAQLNMRVVLGGWLGGDPLPLERRLSVDGPGAVPGYDFRSQRLGPPPDVLTCSSAFVAGQPAECDRIALAQIEYRGDLRFDFTGAWGGEDWPRHYHSAHGDVVWVLFADAGRGWRIGTPPVEGLTYGAGEFPPLSSFRSDIGLGLDFAGIGIYAAKSASAPSEPVNFFVRLRHRF
jgi:hypothetical protein